MEGDEKLQIKLPENISEWSEADSMIFTIYLVWSLLE